MEHNIKELIEMAKRKSQEAIKAAEANFVSGHYETCQNRLYYAIFYIVSALAYKDNFITSKHSQLLGWFNKKYIYEEKVFDINLFAIYKEAYTNRQKSDYDFAFIPDKDDLFALIEDVKFFVKEIQKHL